MATNGDGTPNLTLQTDHLQRPRALAEISYNSIIFEAGTSSDEDGPAINRIATEEARVLDVSIGREQTRLTSPKTPATEKQAAIDRVGGFFGDGVDEEDPEIVEEPGVVEETEVDDGLIIPSNTARKDVIQSTKPRAGHQVIETGTAAHAEAQDSVAELSPTKQEQRLPSPWRSGPKIFERSDVTRQSMRDGLLFGRKRSSSGPESWSKALMSTLPSMPKNFSFTSPFSSSHDDNAAVSINSKRRSSSFLGGNFQWSSMYSPTNTSSAVLAPSRDRLSSGSKQLRRMNSPQEFDEARATVGDLPSRPQLQTLRSRPSQLKRSASDDSLTTARTLSHVESLGDDSRFEHVSDQVNSRMKAIKDSWADSSIKLPSMPSIANFRADFMRERANTGSSTRSVTPSGMPQNEKPVDPFTRQPYHSVKEATTDNKLELTHPHFHRALSRLEGDVVVLGGYRGSILRSAQPPHRQLWVPIKVGLNIRKVDLEVGLNEEDDELATKKVIPGGMLTNIGPVDISRRLFKRLRRCENAVNGKLRVHDYGYDWRLDPNHLGRQFTKFLESLPCNQPGVPKEQRGATVIAHSLGGLITRHVVNQRPDLFRGVVYAGVPKTCVNILGPLRNGDDVLLSSRVLTAQVNFTIRTSFALLPLSGRCFFDKNTREEYPVDFFDPQTWIDCRLSPCLARPLPSLNKQPEPATTGISGYMSSMAKALPNLPGRKNSVKHSSDSVKHTKIAGLTEPDMSSNNNATTSNSDTTATDDGPPSISTAVTISREDAITYLTRTLASVKKFKQELVHVPAHTAANRYPPTALIYGKSTPTVYGAKVDGREGIKHASAYDELAFASGDGVVLAKAAMLPEGYRVAKGGVVSSERGHVTLLGDLEAVGRCLEAVLDGRRRGTGCGVDRSTTRSEGGSMNQ